MEYTKLLETGQKNSEENISSLTQLNNNILEYLGESFAVSHSKNKASISTIRKSDFCSKIRNLRNKTYGHSDNHEFNKPFSFRGFKTEDFQNGNQQLQIVKQVIDRCTEPFDLSLDIDIPNREDRTYNFIKFHAKYQDYYFKNFLEAEFGIKK